MPPPRTPERVDGVRLSPEQQAKLARLVSLIWKAAPSRAPSSILAHAQRAFLLLVERDGPIFRDREAIRLLDGRGLHLLF